jgi:3-dehydroquinate synthase
MPSFRISTPHASYDAVIERGILNRVSAFVPARAGRIFAITTREVWELHGESLRAGLADRAAHVLFFPGGEANKRLAEVETLAEQMVELGGDRTSFVIAFGGGIVNDLGGFLASAFLRGVAVLQIPTTLLAQVDAAVGGKTGVNLVAGKNLFGSFHQPSAVLIDPNVLDTLPDREYRAGLYEIVKCGVIRDPELFRMLEERHQDVLAREPGTVDRIIAAAVRIKAEVVSTDEREVDLRRILNFGHTAGHALEAETRYARFLHGEAVAFGMDAATRLAAVVAELSDAECERILRLVDRYGPIPPLDGVSAESLYRRLASDKKTLQGRLHFVLPSSIGSVRIVADPPREVVMAAIEAAIESHSGAGVR